MSKARKVLVVGTTADYIDLLYNRFSDRVIFVTDFEERGKGKGFLSPGPALEIVLDLEDHEAVIAALKRHLQSHGFQLSGIACFDCESLALAAIVAEAFGLPFQSLDTVMKCRSKFLSKNVWKARGVVCPDAALISTENEAVLFFDSLQGPAVMKPLTGSGSELVFLCRDRESCRAAYKTVTERLRGHLNRRMYTSRHMPVGEDPRKAVVMEQYIPGEEYSCDFIFDGDRAKVLRLTRKYLSRQSTFGSMLAYELPARLPDSFSMARVEQAVQTAAAALGVRRTIAMADFKVWDDKIFLLELTPRPGGDCLPPLIHASCGLDILKAELDFAEGQDIVVPGIGRWQHVVGLHLLATQGGVLKELDAASLADDARVVNCYLKHSKGDTVTLPPEDYDSRLLGHVVFKPSADESIEQQCGDIARKVIVEME
jgi:biotin carboxylase